MSRRDIPRKEKEEQLISCGDYSHLEHLFEDGDESIYMQMFQPLQRSNGNAVVFCHGLGDYGARHADKAEIFLKHGYSVALFDQPGHGRSYGLHGFIDDPAKLVKSTRQVIEKVDSVLSLSSTGGKVFLMGESMGGTTAVLYSIMEKDPRIAGIALVASFLKGHDASRPNFMLVNLARTINYLYPSLPASPAQRGQCHYNPDFEQEFADDPFTYSGWLRVGTGVMFLDALEIIKQNVQKLQTPTLIVHGEKDRVADVEGNRWLASEMSGPVETVWYPEGEHLLFPDYQDEIMTRAVAFFKSCINED